MYGHHIEQSKDQPGKVGNPARGHLNSDSLFAPENLVSRDGFGRPVPRQPTHHLHTQASERQQVNVIIKQFAFREGIN